MARATLDSSRASLVLGALAALVGTAAAVTVAEVSANGLEYVMRPGEADGAAPLCDLGGSTLPDSQPSLVDTSTAFPVRIVSREWDSIDVISHLAALLIAQELSHPVTVVPTAKGTLPVYEDLGAGKDHLLLEAWPLAEESDPSFLVSRSINPVGNHAALGRSGVYLVGPASSDAELATVARNWGTHLDNEAAAGRFGVREDAATGSPGVQLLTGPASFTETQFMCGEGGFLNGTGLNVTCNTLPTEDALSRAVRTRFQAGRDAMFISYTTSVLLSGLLNDTSLAVHRVLLPPTTAECLRASPVSCDFPRNTLRKLAWSGLRVNYAPRISDFAWAFSLTAADMRELVLLAHTENQRCQQAAAASAASGDNATAVCAPAPDNFVLSPTASRRAACRWAQDHQAQVKPWLQGCDAGPPLPLIPLIVDPRLPHGAASPTRRACSRTRARLGAASWCRCGAATLARRSHRRWPSTSAAAAACEARG